MAQHNELGRLGEQFATCYLQLHGWEILEVDWHFGHIDIDIVAQKLGWLAFVEVKTRRSSAYEAPEEAVDQEKIQNLLKAANAFIKLHELENPYRFDIISLVGTAWPFEITHIKNAFNPIDYNTDLHYKRPPLARRSYYHNPPDDDTRPLISPGTDDPEPLLD